MTLMALKRFTAAATLICLAAPGVSAESTLNLADSSSLAGPGPGDNMVFAIRRQGTFVVSLSFVAGQAGEAVTHRLGPDGKLSYVGRAPAGVEPRAVAMARKGDFAVVVNSASDSLTVMSVGDDGMLTPVGTSPSGGVNPFKVAVAYQDIVVVANRDSNQINTFHMDGRGRLRALDSESTGLAPHVVVASPRGLVAAVNQVGQSLSLFEMDRGGRLTKLGTDVALGLTPRTASWRGRDLFVALDGGTEDVIRSFHVTREGVVQAGSDTPCGVFLTDIEANDDGVVLAVTVNVNGAGNADDRDEVRAYRADGTTLTLDATYQTPGVPPSFKQVASGAFGGSQARHVVVSEFGPGGSGSWLRSLIYLPLVVR